MHITEGILPASWAGLWFLVAAPFVWWGLHTVNYRRAAEPRYMILVALVGSAIFVISCMPVPVPWVGTCSHPLRHRAWGAMLIGPGPTVVVLTSIALVSSGFVFVPRGIDNVGGEHRPPWAWSGHSTPIFRIPPLRSASRVPHSRCGVLRGLISDWGTYATTSLELSSALHGDGSMGDMFLAVLAAFVPTQFPLGLIEGVMTAVAYQFVLSPAIARFPSVAGE